MTTKTLSAAAIAALALTGVAEAKKPEKPAKPAKAPKAQSVGFSATGVGVTGLTDAGTGAFSLDLTKANTHALAALKLTKADLAKAVVTQIPADANGFEVRLDESVVDGSDEGTDITVADVLATDRVKVIGKVTRTRNARTAKGKRTSTYSTIDIKKVVVSRGEAA